MGVENGVHVGRAQLDDFGVLGVLGAEGRGRGGLPDGQEGGDVEDKECGDQAAGGLRGSRQIFRRRLLGAWVVPAHEDEQGQDHADEMGGEAEGAEGLGGPHDDEEQAPHEAAENALGGGDDGEPGTGFGGHADEGEPRGEEEEVPEAQKRDGHAGGGGAGRGVGGCGREHGPAAGVELGAGGIGGAAKTGEKAGLGVTQIGGSQDCGEDEAQEAEG